MKATIYIIGGFLFLSFCTVLWCVGYTAYWLVTR